MKKNTAVLLSVILLVASILGILGTQLLNGGQNPRDLLLFLLLMMIGGSAETITFTAFKNKFVKILPLLVAIAVALWGVYLYFFSPFWENAAPADLICGYCAPVVGSVISVVLMKFNIDE